MHCPFHVEINNERRKTIQKIKINRHEPLKKESPPAYTTNFTYGMRENYVAYLVSKINLNERKDVDISIW